MKRNTRRRWIGMLSLGLIAVTAIVVVLAVFAGTNDTSFTATGYSDVIRFQAEGVATLQVRIFDLSGREIWDSGMVSGDIIDWDRRNDTGERLAYGAYIYSAQGWNASGDLNFQKNGKLALMPGDTVQLQQAPVLNDTTLAPFGDMSLSPKELTRVPGNFTSVTVSGVLYPLYNMLSSGAGAHQWAFFGGANAWNIRDLTAGTSIVKIEQGAPSSCIYIKGIGTVGIGTNAPTAKLTVQATSGDLIAAYNSGNRVFVVKNNGEVRADGAYYSGTGGFHTGNADVAERINTSEWVDPGNVVEIDPEHPGFFRKASSPYSTKVAGIISTSPGVILGNNFDEATDDWNDNRPVLAVTGRVPCKVSAENGPIEIGDLLVASSTPGIAMKGDPERAIGAVVGKAMEPLEDGEGTIVVQVMLR